MHWAIHVLMKTLLRCHTCKCVHLWAFLKCEKWNVSLNVSDAAAIKLLSRNACWLCRWWCSCCDGPIKEQHHSWGKDQAEPYWHLLWHSQELELAVHITELSHCHILVNSESLLLTSVRSQWFTHVALKKGHDCRKDSPTETFLRNLMYCNMNSFFKRTELCAAAVWDDFILNVWDCNYCAHRFNIL